MKSHYGRIGYCNTVCIGIVDIEKRTKLKFLKCEFGSRGENKMEEKLRNGYKKAC